MYILIQTLTCKYSNWQKQKFRDWYYNFLQKVCERRI